MKSLFFLSKYLFPSFKSMFLTCTSLLIVTSHCTFVDSLQLWVHGSIALTTLETAVGGSLKWEHRIAITDSILNLDSVSLLPPVACVDISCMNLPAQQLKVSLTAPLSVCVCVLTSKSAGLLLWSCWLEMDLEPHATAGVLASCLLLVECVCVCVHVFDQSYYTSRQKNTYCTRLCACTSACICVRFFTAYTLAQKTKPTNHRQHQRIYFTIKYSEDQAFGLCHVKVHSVAVQKRAYNPAVRQLSSLTSKW